MLTAGSTSKIDDGLSPAYTIKQIGTNAIADNSITSSKPAQSFMKRVTVLDNAAGHLVGWDPNGAATLFFISEPAIATKDDTFVNILVGGTLNNCEVNGIFGGPHQFTILCEFPPESGAQLHYVIENLPAHVVS